MQLYEYLVDSRFDLFSVGKIDPSYDDFEMYIENIGNHFTLSHKALVKTLDTFILMYDYGTKYVIISTREMRVGKLDKDILEILQVMDIK